MHWSASISPGGETTAEATRSLPATSRFDELAQGTPQMVFKVVVLPAEAVVRAPGAFDSFHLSARTAPRGPPLREHGYSPSMWLIS